MCAAFYVERPSGHWLVLLVMTRGLGVVPHVHAVRQHDLDEANSVFETTPNASNTVNLVCDGNDATFITTFLNRDYHLDYLSFVDSRDITHPV